MPRITKAQVVDSLYVATEQDRIEWQPTAEAQQFIATFGPKWSVVISRSFNIAFAPQPLTTLFVMKSDGEALLQVQDSDDPRLRELHEMARRRALKIDDDLTDFLNEVDKPPK